MVDGRETRLGVGAARRQLRTAVDRQAGTWLGEPRRVGGQDHWPIATHEGLWLVVEVRDDAGAPLMRSWVEDRRSGESPGDPTNPTFPLCLPWSVAAPIGRASDVTCRLRIYRNRLYWSAEASKDEIYLATQDQMDRYLATGLPRVLAAAVETAGKIARDR